MWKEIADAEKRGDPNLTVDFTDSNGKKEAITLKVAREKAFYMPKITTAIKDDHLAKTFILLKRAQKLLDIKCQHPIEPEVEFVLDQANDQTLFDAQGRRVDIKQRWRDNNWCERAEFTRNEIQQLFEKVGFAFSGIKADDIMFRGNLDRDQAIQ